MGQKKKLNPNINVRFIHLKLFYQEFLLEFQPEFYHQFHLFLLKVSAGQEGVELTK